MLDAGNVPYRTEVGSQASHPLRGLCGRLDGKPLWPRLANVRFARDTPWVTLPEDRYYRRDLALIHHRGFGSHALAAGSHATAQAAPADYAPPRRAGVSPWSAMHNRVCALLSRARSG
jgi:hypothetical protein